MKVETVEEFLARGGQINTLPPSPRMTPFEIQIERAKRRLNSTRGKRLARLVELGKANEDELNLYHKLLRASEGNFYEASLRGNQWTYTK